MPARLIRFVHDATTHSAKAQLFADCRAGKVAVLLGSTDKLGVGTNVQRLCAAIHDVDAPHRPADLDQRRGRGDRPGNLMAPLRIFRYVTERSFDSYMWQALERKARFIAQVLTGQLAAREVEDIGDATLTYTEIKALATGNPLLLRQAEAQADVARLRQLAIAHERGRLRARSQIERFREEAALHAARASLWRTLASAGASGGALLHTVGAGVVAPDAEAAALGTSLRDALASAARGFSLQNVGTWGGLNLRIEVEQRWPAQTAWFVVDDVDGGSVRIEVKTSWSEPERARHLSRVLREATTAASQRAAHEAGRETACLAEVDAAMALTDAAFSGALDLRRAETRLAEINKAIGNAVEDPMAA